MPSATMIEIDAAVAEIRGIAENEPASGLRRVIIRRNMNFLKRFLENATDSDVERAAGADSDFGSVLVEMNLPATMDVAVKLDPLAEARVRGLKMMEQLLNAEGGYLGAGDVAKRLKITPAGVNQRLRRNNLIAVNLGRKGFAYPVWQFANKGGTLPGLGEILDALKENDCDSWDIYTFFLNPTHALQERSPLEELRAGNIATVLQAAKSYGQHGAL